MSTLIQCRSASLGSHYTTDGNHPSILGQPERDTAPFPEPVAKYRAALGRWFRMVAQVRAGPFPRGGRNRNSSDSRLQRLVGGDNSA